MQLLWEQNKRGNYMAVFLRDIYEAIKKEEEIEHLYFIIRLIIH